MTRLSTLLALVLGAGLTAHGQEPAAADAATAAAPSSTRMRCKAFESALGAELDTHDLDTPMGAWLERAENEGWDLAQVDFEIGQKPTGFAQGYTQLCVTPRTR